MKGTTIMTTTSVGPMKPVHCTVCDQDPCFCNGADGIHDAEASSAIAMVVEQEPGIQEWVSGSALGLAVKCSASAVLPRVLGLSGEPARIGSALHDHIRHRNLYGVASALEMLDQLVVAHELSEAEAELFKVRARAFEWSPPKGAIAEVALCLFDDGRVEVVRGGKGQYEKIPGALVPTQIDLFWAEPAPLYREGSRIICPPDSILWVVDFKSGKEQYVDPAGRNAQVLAGMVTAAKLTGAKRAIPAIVYLRKGQGIWDVAEHWFDEAAIAKVEETLANAVHAVRKARRDYPRGLPLAYTEGAHCGFCRARNACPAHLASLKHWLDVKGPLEIGALPDHQIRRLAELAPSFMRFALSVPLALRAHVEETGRPIVLSDGKVWGPYPKPTEAWDAEKAIAALSEEIGPEAAKAARPPPKIAKARIEKAIKAAHAEKGIIRKGAAAMRGVWARLKRADGIREGVKVVWGPHKPEPKQPVLHTQAVIAELHGLPIDGDFEDEDEEGDDAS